MTDTEKANLLEDAEAWCGRANDSTATLLVHDGRQYLCCVPSEEGGPPTFGAGFGGTWASFGPDWRWNHVGDVNEQPKDGKPRLAGKPIFQVWAANRPIPVNGGGFDLARRNCYRGQSVFADGYETKFQTSPVLLKAGVSRRSDNWGCLVLDRPLPSGFVGGPVYALVNLGATVAVGSVALLGVVHDAIPAYQLHWARVLPAATLIQVICENPIGPEVPD